MLAQDDDFVDVSDLSSNFDNPSRGDVMLSVHPAMVFVARGVTFGLFVLRSISCAFRKVFLAVGEVAESVSSLRLVEPLPNTGATLKVLRDNLGFFDGVGPGVANVGIVG